MKTQALVLLAIGGLASFGCRGGRPTPVAMTVVVSPAAPQDETVRCAEETSSRDGPVCVYKIDEETLSHRHQASIFSFERGRLVRIERVNGSRALRDDEPCALLELGYDGRGRVATTTCRNARHRVSWVETSLEDGAVTTTVDDRGWPYRCGGEGGAAMTRHDLDGKGLVRSDRFFDGDGKPCTNKHGAYELRYERDPSGAVVETVELDASRQPMLDQEGVHRVTYERDARCGVVLVRFFGLRGEPVDATLGWSFYRVVLDRWGNRAETSFFAKDGAPALDAWDGHRATRRHDDRGDVVEEKLFDAGDRLFAGKTGWAIVSESFDPRGRVVEKSVFDASSRPIYTRRFRRDAVGRVVEMSELTPSRPEVVTKSRYDDRDNLVEMSYFEASGAPHAFSGRACGYRIAYDDRDREIDRGYVDSNGTPVARDDGTVFLKKTYDAAGRAVDERLDADHHALVVYGAKHIVIQFAGATRADPKVSRTKAEARRRCEEAKRKISKGLSFDDAVDKYSDEAGSKRVHGDLGRFRTGQMVKEFEDGIANTKVGEVSACVETPFGFHLIERLE